MVYKEYQNNVTIFTDSNEFYKDSIMIMMNTEKMAILKEK